MSTNLKVISTEKLCEYIELKVDILNEVKNRLELLEQVQDDLSDAEIKIDDLEEGIQTLIDNAKGLI